MKHFLKVFSVLLLFGFLFVSIPLTKAGFVPARNYDIRNDYCGPVMDYKYCKCAFHGQYCDAIGIDSGGANNYVQGGFSTWVEGQRQKEKERCTQGGGFWQGNGCNYCDSPSFRWQGSCKTIADVCSDDSQVRFDIDTGKCFCVEGYELLSDRTCESICPEGDPSIVYDPDLDDCVCAPGYEEKNNECVEAPEVEIWVTLPNKGNPILADGKKEYVIPVEIFKLKNGEGVDATFSISYTSATQKGEVIDVKKLEKGKYEVHYKTADLTTSGHPGVHEDGLYVHYYSDKEEKEVYKTFSIPIAVGLQSQVKITKPGYNEVIEDIVFTAPTALVKTYTVIDGNKVPVAGAQCVLPGQWSYETFEGNSSGEVVIEAPENIDSDFVSEIEVELTLDATTKDDMEDAKGNIADIRSNTSINAPITENFLNEFEVTLAAASNITEAEQLVAGVKRVKWALFAVYRGYEMSEANAKGLVGSIKDTLWDIMDMMDVINQITGYLTKKIKPYIEKPMELVKELGKGEAEAIATELQNLSASFEGMASKFFDKASQLFRSGLARFAPNIPQDWADKLLAATRDKAGEYGQKTLWEIDSFDTWLKNFFLKEFEKQSEFLVGLIEEKVQHGGWNTVHIDSNLMQSRWKHYDMMADFHIASNRDVIMSEFKAEFEYVALDITAGTLNILTGGSKAVKIFEKAYKSLRLLINNDVMYTWFDAVGNALQDTTDAVIYALGGSSNTTSFTENIIPSAYAASDADDMPDSDADDTIDAAALEAVYKYNLSDTDAAFYEDLASITRSLEKIYSDAPEVKELDQYIEGKLDEIKTTRNELRKAAAPYLEDVNPLDEDGDGKITLADITAAEWAVLGGLVLASLIVLWIAIKVLRKIFRKK